jgi:hypothetical protein
LTLRSKGTPEQVAALPKPLFLFPFVRAWNKRHNEPNFLDEQLQALQEFDAAERVASPLPASTPTPTATTPAPLPSILKKPPVHRPAARVLQGSTAPLPLPSPPPPPIVRTDKEKVANFPVHRHRVIPPQAQQRRKVVVEVPPRPPRKLKEIEDEDEEDDSSPPPPTRHNRHMSESDPDAQTIEVFVKVCPRCQNAGRLCVVDEVGSACVGCKTRKYGCTHTSKKEDPKTKKNDKTMWVTVPVVATDSGSEVEVVEDSKGKKRRAESPLPPSKKVKVKVEKREKVEKPRKAEKPKVKVEKKPTASGSKAKGRSRPAPKSSAVIANTSEEDDEAMVVDGDAEEPKPKRARLTKTGKSIDSSRDFYLCL